VVERINGKQPSPRGTHGGIRRGVFPVPSLEFATQQAQSKRDKSRLIEMMKQRNNARIETLELQDLGNKELPAYGHKQEILTNIEAYKAVILGGATGSGKSTQLPQYLYEAGYDMTIVMVPRRIIADGLGERIREEMSSQIEGFNADETVGIIHGERSERHENNKIIVMTPNTFNKMEKDLRVTLGDKKVAIIADEIHEANLFTEIATGVAAMSVRDRDNWRLIAASATHNASTLQRSLKELNGGYVPSINIEGRPFEVDMQEVPNETPMEVFAHKGSDHLKSMIFTSGKREINHIIEQTTVELEKNEEGSSKNVIFRKLHGELSSFELSHIDDPIPEDYRLVIVSSPAGMSGITIPGVTLVITDGTINRQELDEDGIAGIARHYLAKAEVTQQIGRAGRDVTGGIGIIAKPTTVIDDVLRSKGRSVEVPQMEYMSFDEREDHAPPEIYSSNLSRVVLSVAALDRRFGDINPYIPHTVKASSIIAAEESLSRLGALDDDDKITPIGTAMDAFPISPELSRGLYEVSRGGRTLQHLARAAFIAAAVDVGGLQDFADARVMEWKKLIRPTTTDDFMAQLDMMIALEDHGRTELPQHEFIETFTLSPKRVERAQKVSRKILHAFKIRSDNTIIVPPLPDEELQLRHDFTAGMIDLVYEETGTKVARKAEYRNIHGDDESTKRLISGRSISVPEKGQLVAGMPRWYTKRNKQNEEIRFDIVEMTLDVDPAVVGVYALANNLLRGKLIAPRFEGDRIVEREQMMFGSIPVAGPVTTIWREKNPESSRSLLVERSLNAPGEAQQALRDIADELELYHQRIPADILKEYKLQHAPVEITKAFIATLIEREAETTRSLSEIDNGLGLYLYRKNMTINLYFNNATRQELQQRSPVVIPLSHGDVRVLYQKGQPYITQITKEQRTAITKPLYLSDGREVLLQVPVKGGGTTRISFGVE
jgi:HrpA-like RNA helicase